MRKIWVLFLIVMVSTPAMSAPSGVATTEYVQSYLRNAADMPELELTGVAPNALASEEYVLSAIDFVNGGGDLVQYARPNTIAGISYLPNIADKINTCPIPWDDTPGITQFVQYSAKKVFSVSKELLVEKIKDTIQIDSTYSYEDFSFSSALYNGKNIMSIVSVTYTDSSSSTTVYYAIGSDGTNVWLKQLPSSTKYNHAYFDGKFIILLDNVELYSYDAIEWHTIENFPQTNYNSISHQNDRIILDRWGSGYDEYIWYSTDGLNWESVTVPDRNSLLGGSIVFGNGKWIITAGRYTENNEIENVIYDSYDGVNWNMRQSSIGVLPLAGLAYGNGIFVLALTHNNYFLYSTDGENWSQTPTPIRNEWSFVNFSNGIFVATSPYASPSWLYSVDGINWLYGGEDTTDYTRYQNGYLDNIFYFDQDVFVKKIVPTNNSNLWVVGQGCLSTTEMCQSGVQTYESSYQAPKKCYLSTDVIPFMCDTVFVGGNAICEKNICSCQRTHLRNGDAFDETLGMIVEIPNHTFADQDACNTQCADICADNAVNNTDGAQKEILCGK